MSKTCNQEGCIAPHLAGGLCQKHYWRMRRGGTTAPRNRPRHGFCTHTNGCDRVVHAKQLCSMHYQQERGPIYTLWCNMRARSPNDMARSWTDFEAFRDDVGVRPSPKHQLRRLDKELPWGPENFEWRPPIRVGGKTGLTKNMAQYQLAWKYMRQFGLTEEDVVEIETAQDGKCPICSRGLRTVDDATDKPGRIVLDHDHRTGAVRGLLHDRCNKAIGLFDDDTAAMRRAIEYVEFHRAVGDEL